MRQRTVAEIISDDIEGRLDSLQPIDDLAGHQDIAPGRKTDPGPAFDWARFQRLVARSPGSQSRGEPT